MQILIEGVRGEDFAGWLAQQVGPYLTQLKVVLQKTNTHRSVNLFFVLATVKDE